MQVLFAYLLKLAFCLALGYLFYFLLLRRITYYTWNRYFLLFFSLAAIAIPVLPLQLPGNLKTFNAVYFITGALPAISQVTHTGNGLQDSIQWSLSNIALLVILTGMAFFLLRFIVRLYSLYKTRSIAKLVNEGDVKLYHLENCSSPFSFNNSIYLDTTRYDQQELEKILEHEMVHVTQKHTTDMLVAEILCIVQWFNPFVWLMKQAIKQNLEFIADDSVLQKGINRASYQFLLLKVSGAMPHSIANNLLFPSLKKRIQMMNRTRTGRIHLLKFMCIVPLGCVLLFSFSGPAGKPPANDTAPDAFSLSSLSFYINDEGVAALIKKEEQKSFLKSGGPLSLSLISDEKNRLNDLLEKNGYDNLSSHAITFVMDTSAANHSFSVQVTIHLEKNKKDLHQLNKNTEDVSAAADIEHQTQPKYIITTDEKKRDGITVTHYQPVNKPPVASAQPTVMQ